MRLRHLYLFFAFLGAALPYAFFVPFLAEHGLDVPELMTQLFANRAGGFFGVDVFVSAAVLLTFILAEGERLGLRRLWIPIVGTLVVGVSFGLPLFLFFRQRHLDARRVVERSGDRG